jgi:CHAT domain-containing protein
VLAAQYQNQAVSHLLGSEHAAALEKLASAAALYRSASLWEQYFSCLNQISSIYLETAQYDEAKRTAKKALWESIEKLGRDNAEAARAAHKLGEVYSGEGRQEDALESHRLALMIRRKLYGEQHPELADSYDWIGKAYTSGQAYEKAETHFQQSLALRKTLFGTTGAEIAVSYYLLGELEASRQKSKAALEYHIQALAIREKKLDPLDPGLFHSYIKLAGLYEARGEEEKAAQHYRSALQIWEQGGLLRQEDMLVPLYFLTAAHLRKGKITAAKASARQLLRLPLGKTRPSGVQDYELATDFFCRGSMEEAIAFFERALSSKEGVPLAACYHQLISALRQGGQPTRAISRSRDYLASASSPLALAGAQLQIGYSLLNNGEPQAALPYLAEGLLAGSIPASWKQEGLLAQAEAYRQMRDFEPAIQLARQAAGLASNQQGTAFFRVQAHYIMARAHSALALQDRNTLLNLEASLEAAQAADEELKALLQQPLMPWQISWLLQQQGRLYEKAIQACFSLNQQRQKQAYANQAFYFAERSKQMGLATPLLLVDEIAYANVPLQLVEEENALKHQIRRLAHTLHITALLDVPADKLEQELKDYQAKFAANLLSIKQKAPKYFELKYESPIAELSRLQPLLKSQGAVLYAYFVGRLHYYVFFADGKGLSFFQSPLGPELREDLKNFSYLSGQDKRDKLASPEHFAALSASLYRKLLPVKPESNISQLCILPHGPLELFPFEALLPGMPASAAFSNLPYLGNQYSITYNYQASALMEDGYVANASHPLPFYAFIPDYGTPKKRIVNNASAMGNAAALGEALSSLPHFSKLSAWWVGEFGGETWTGGNANEHALRRLPKAGILLAAAQTVLAAEPLDSYISLSGPADSLYDNLVSIEEIYGMAQLAELGILASSIPLEGLSSVSFMHLARALQYNGCNALVLHRWPNPGTPSEEVIQLFLENYQPGTSIPTALQKARQAYLALQNDKPTDAHPYYWAGYMHFGALKPLPLQAPVSPYWIIAGIALLILVGWWAKQR